MGDQIPVKARRSGGDVVALGEFESGDVIDGVYLKDASVTSDKLGSASVNPDKIAGSITQFYTDSGVANAYVLTRASTTPAITAYNNGASYEFVAGNDGTGAATANIDSLGVKNIKLAGGTDPASGDISGRTVVTYDSGNDWLELQIGNGSAGNVSFDNTSTGLTATDVQAAIDEGIGANQARVCSAWVNFNGTGTVAIRDQYNVASITDNGTGDYTVNFAVALANSDYSQAVSSNAANSNSTDSGKLTSSCEINTLTSSNSASDALQCNVHVFGGQ